MNRFDIFCVTFLSRIVKIVDPVADRICSATNVLSTRFAYPLLAIGFALELAGQRLLGFTWVDLFILFWVWMLYRGCREVDRYLERKRRDGPGAMPTVLMVRYLSTHGLYAVAVTMQLTTSLLASFGEEGVAYRLLFFHALTHLIALGFIWSMKSPNGPGLRDRLKKWVEERTPQLVPVPT